MIGSGTRATVYEAVQLNLDRRVALKVMHDRSLADRVRRLAWPEHPGAVSLYAAGDSEHGPWLAMRLVAGGTLETRRAPLDAVAAALARAHASGIVHGDVSARNVLVEDGRAYLSDFGLAGGEATADDDRAALAALVRDRSPRTAHRRARSLAIAVVALAGIAVGVTAMGGDGGSGAERAAAPPRPSGTRSIGSGLAPGAYAGVDCQGRAPGGASPACTISQRELAGRAVVAPADGTITSWAVRGTRGPVALQVLRGRGSRLIQVGRSRDVEVPGPEPHVLRSDLAVNAGDRVALEVSPTTSVGIRRNRSRSAVDRWIGPLLEPARAPERPAGTGFDHELLLRVDIAPRARAGPRAQRR